MVVKQREIKRLIKPKLGYLILQSMIAELVYETRKLHKSQNYERRYAAIIKATIGIKVPKKKRKDYKNDERLLTDAAVLYKLTKYKYKHMRNAAKLLPKRFEKMTLGSAIAEAARATIIKGYVIGQKIPKDITTEEAAELKAARKRLSGKLKKSNVDAYAKKRSLHTLQDFVNNELDPDLEEIEFMQSLIPDWIKKYGKQVTFR